MPGDHVRVRDWSLARWWSRRTGESANCVSGAVGNVTGAAGLPEEPVAGGEERLWHWRTAGFRGLEEAEGCYRSVLVGRML